MRLIFFALGLIGCVPTAGPAGGGTDVVLLEGVEMGADFETLLEVLNEQCAETTVIEEPSPRYPLAQRSEAHVLCEDYSGGPLGFRLAAFVVADGRFVQMEALGVSRPNVDVLLGDADGTYMEMANYRQGTLWYDNESARLIWLSEEAVHPNLFAWPNARLPGRSALPGNESTDIPELLDFASNLRALEPAFERQCTQVVIHRNQHVWLPNEPESQVQIDCFGFPYAGFARKLEAVFGDGKLQVIWVLSAKPEESRLRARLIRDWGEPVLINDTWEVFGDGRISLRKDKPELLILSDEMIPLYQDEFGSE